MTPKNDPLALSRQLVYFAAERTLSGWIRTALSLMALGFVVERFGLILLGPKMPGGSASYSHALSEWGGVVLVGFGVVMTMTAGIRYLLFALAYHRDGSTDVGRGLIHGAAFALLLGMFGLALLGVLTVVMG